MSRIVDLAEKKRNALATAESARKQEKTFREQAEFMEEAAAGFQLLIEKEGPVNGHDPEVGKKSAKVEKV